jgi:hypothetical protein
VDLGEMISLEETERNLSAVESKPASDGRIKTSHFFCLNRAGIFWQEVILHWGLIHRKASERSGFEVVLFGWSYFGV